MAEQAEKTSSGVQELINRLRDEGVGAGRSEAERIVTEARGQAAALVSEARNECSALREQARIDIEQDREAAQQALRLAARDTVLELRDRVTRHFEQHVRRLVSQVSIDEDLVRSLILVLGGRVAEEVVRDRDAEIIVSQMLYDKAPAEDDGSADERARRFILGITGTMLREGLELIPEDSLGGGAHVRVKGEDAEIDLSDEAVSALLIKHLLPRFQAILEGSEPSR